MKKFIFYFLILLMILVLFFLKNRKEYEISKTKIIMSTYVEIILKSKKYDNTELEKIVDSSFLIMKNYENKLSYYDKNSLLSKINDNLIEDMDNDIYKILMKAKDLYYSSDSLYDVSIGSLLDLWKVSQRKIPPKNEEIAKCKFGFYQLKFDSNKIIKSKEIKLNFGSLAKGYIIDRTFDYLKEKKLTQIIINAGGDIRIGGNYPKKVGIIHPREKKIIKEINILNEAVVTSGDYERCFIYKGKRYSHIIDPKTKFPVKDIISVTVVAKNAFLADALSTTIFLLKKDNWESFIKNYPKIKVIIYYLENEKIKEKSFIN